MTKEKEAEIRLEANARKEYELLKKYNLVSEFYCMKINDIIVKIGSFDDCNNYKEALMPCFDWNNVKTICIEKYRG